MLSRKFGISPSQGPASVGPASASGRPCPCRGLWTLRPSRMRPHPLFPEVHGPPALPPTPSAAPGPPALMAQRTVLSEQLWRYRNDHTLCGKMTSAPRQPDDIAMVVFLKSASWSCLVAEQASPRQEHRRA